MSIQYFASPPPTFLHIICISPGHSCLGIQTNSKNNKIVFLWFIFHQGMVHFSAPFSNTIPQFNTHLKFLPTLPTLCSRPWKKH